AGDLAPAMSGKLGWGFYCGSQQQLGHAFVVARPKCFSTSVRTSALLAQSSIFGKISPRLHAGSDLEKAREASPKRSSIGSGVGSPSGGGRRFWSAGRARRYSLRSWASPKRRTTGALSRRSFRRSIGLARVEGKAPDVDQVPRHNYQRPSDVIAAGVHVLETVARGCG